MRNRWEKSINKFADIGGVRRGKGQDDAVVQARRVRAGLNLLSRPFPNPLSRFNMLPFAAVAECTIFSH